MISYQGHVKEDVRSSERTALQGSIIIAKGVQAVDGRILNVSVSGCLVDAPVRVKAGDPLQLRLFLPGADLSMCVSLAVVRWAQGFLVGVEFTKVDESDRACRSHFIALQEDQWKLAL